MTQTEKDKVEANLRLIFASKILYAMAVGNCYLPHKNFATCAEWAVKYMSNRNPSPNYLQEIASNQYLENNIKPYAASVDADHTLLTGVVSILIYSQYERHVVAVDQLGIFEWATEYFKKHCLPQDNPA